MRNIFALLLVSFFTFALVANDASAKRFGSGRSFGVQRSQSSLSKPAPVHNTAAAQTPNPASKWGGILGGLLVGGLLASLFMGHGFTSGIFAWLLVGGLIFLLVNFMRRKMQPGFQSYSSTPGMQNPFNQFTASAAATSNTTTNIDDQPPGFDSAQMLRDAKVIFYRLQTAYDQKNLQDINQFTAPEVFGEIKMQLDERGDTPNKTEVISLDAELLDISRQANTYIASVRFTGYIKENDDPMTSLDEIWHFRKFTPSSEWVVGGIQQEVL
jgi:predicted lipid-binding transport protein (Tim44 family)